MLRSVRRFVLLFVGLWATTLLAKEPYELATCPALFRSMIRPELADEDLDKILLGGETHVQVADMGNHALSFLAGGEHLSGHDKADLWERFAVRIAQLSGRRFTCVPQYIDDTRYAVYRGHRGELLAIDLTSGQLYRGWHEELIPENFDVGESIRTQRLRPLGSASP